MKRRQEWHAIYLDRNSTFIAIGAALLRGCSDWQTLITGIAVDPYLYCHRTFTSLPQSLHWLKGEILADKSYFFVGQVVCIEEDDGGRRISQVHACDDLGILLSRAWKAPEKNDIQEC